MCGRCTWLCPAKSTLARRIYTGFYTMLRLLVLLLLLFNGGYFAWSQGYLAGYGLAPTDTGEPQRLAQQIYPESIRLVGADEARRLDSQHAAATATSPSDPASAALAVQSAKTCLQAGVFDDSQAQNLRRTLESVLPRDSWRFDPVVLPARWIIYMGKYDSAEGVLKKRGELRYLNIPVEAPRNPSLEPGLSLGGFETQAAAAAGLVQMAQRGVRTAHVVQERVEGRGQLLRLPQADEVLRAQLERLKPALAGKSLQPCPATVAPPVPATASLVSPASPSSP